MQGLNRYDILTQMFLSCQFTPLTIHTCSCIREKPYTQKVFERLKAAFQSVTCMTNIGLLDYGMITLMNIEIMNI